MKDQRKYKSCQTWKQQRRHTSYQTWKIRGDTKAVRHERSEEMHKLSDMKAAEETHKLSDMKDQRKYTSYQTWKIPELSEMKAAEEIHKLSDMKDTRAIRHESSRVKYRLHNARILHSTQRMLRKLDLWRSVLRWQWSGHRQSDLCCSRWQKRWRSWSTASGGPADSPPKSSLTLSRWRASSQ